jgi:hypothetical protein
MAIQPYRLTVVLRSAVSDAGPTRRTATIAAETAEEAVELAQVFRAGMPSEAVVSATLTDTAGAVLWSERDGGEPDAAMRRRDPS